MARPSSGSASLFQLASRNDAKRKAQIGCTQDSSDEFGGNDYSVGDLAHEQELKQIREKYMLQNKSLARSNSLMVSRIGDMEAKISELINENITIRRNDLELRKQMAAQLDIMQKMISSNVEVMMDALKKFRETYCEGIETHREVEAQTQSAPRRVEGTGASSSTIEAVIADIIVSEQTKKAEAPANSSTAPSQADFSPVKLVKEDVKHARSPANENAFSVITEAGPKSATKTSRTPRKVTPSPDSSVSKAVASPKRSWAHEDFKSARGRKRPLGNASGIASNDESSNTKSSQTDIVDDTPTNRTSHTKRSAHTALGEENTRKNSEAGSGVQTTQTSKKMSGSVFIDRPTTSGPHMTSMEATDQQESTQSRRSRRLSYKVDYKAPKLNTKIRRESVHMIDAVTENYNYFKPVIKMEDENTAEVENKKQTPVRRRSKQAKRPALANLDINMNLV